MYDVRGAMSEIGDKIQEKCLAFGDRIIKLNDYLLEQASLKYDVRKCKSSFSHQTSDLSQPSSFSHQTSDLSQPSYLSH